MTPISRGHAKRLGLRKPESFFELSISGPTVMSDEQPHPLWLSLQRQIYAGPPLGQITIDPDLVEDYARSQEPEAQVAVAKWLKVARQRP